MLTVTQQGNALDLTSKMLIFTLKHNRTDVGYIFRKQSGTGIVSSNPVSGIAIMTIDPTDTASLTANSLYGLDCDLVLVDGSHVYELDSGKLDVLGNITDV